MKKSQRKAPIKDERDKQIDLQAKNSALEYMIGATQVLTVICLIKGNPAWKGSLSLLFFVAAFTLFYKYQQYIEKPYRLVGIIFLVIGIALLIWFGITG